jgi:glutamyl-tRNA synthetase
MPRARVRFAPSPTGFLHVGGARTAIFNWLFAKRHDGVFVLRIEDTDLERSSEPMVRAILDGMAWLGMSPDEGPFYQTQARARHVADAERMLRSGHAYRCFCDPETIKAERADAEKAGKPYVYPRRCLALSSDESAGRAAAGEPFAVRCRVPEGPVEWDDLVHGRTSFDGAAIEDFVLLRSDGSPTYMLSVVSDDIAMEITQVVRGDDHLSNTPKQILLYRALGEEPPAFAHLPLILGDDKKRLSKRHGAMSVLEYRDLGYLPEAMFNFLALLGWSPGDDRQKLGRAELIELFDLSGVGKSGAVFDLKKLEWLNGQYLTETPAEALVPEIVPRLEAAGLWSEDYAGARREWFLSVIRLLQPRSRTLADFVTDGRPFFDPSDDLAYDPEAAKKHLKGDGLAASLATLRMRFAAAGSWTKEALEETLRAVAAEQGISAGKLIHPVRLAVTGRGVSPGLFEVLELLGRERVLARIDRMCDHLTGKDRVPLRT